MNVLDWIFVVLIFLLGARCMSRGFVAEILAVASVGLGIIAALLLYKGAAALLRDKLGITTLPEVLAFAVIFLIVFFIVRIIDRMVREGLEASQLGALDRVLGLVLGLVEGIVLTALILVGLSLLQPLLKEVVDISALLKGSAFGRVILPIVGPEVAKVAQGISTFTPAPAPPATKP
jgi:membrane protein required for colicin V production